MVIWTGKHGFFSTNSIKIQRDMQFSKCLFVDVKLIIDDFRIRLILQMNQNVPISVYN